MAVQTVPCRVCGKMFVPCNKTSSDLGAFNYHAVACSPECGAEYIRRVQAARQNHSNTPDTKVSTDDKNVNNTEPKSTRSKKRKSALY